MKVIVDAVSLIKKIIGKQDVNEDAIYRLSNHCIQIPRPEGLLLYHLMTKELVLLSIPEALYLDHLPCKINSNIKQLAIHWYLRPVEDDDIKLVDQVKAIAASIGPKENNLTSYTIFTTTDCNARCFYCFERGNKKISMTPETARDLGQYIVKQYDGKQVKLRWFGGEPLLNFNAIDIITNSLQQHNIDYCSTMISNGYLFNDDIINRAKKNWKLQHVQITLDGTEQVYNFRKAYYKIKGSAFKKVINNIHKLLNAEIDVTVRLNMEEKNEKDLYW